MQSTAHDFKHNVDEALADPNLQDSLANLNIEKREFANAEKLALQALDFYLETKDAPDEVSVRCTLVQAYLGMQRKKDAEEQILKARERVYGLQGPFPLAVFSIQQAIVENTPKPSTAAIAELKKVEAAMRKAGSLQLALEARRARAEALTGLARKSELKAVAEEARRHGYLLLARKATEMSGA